MFINSPDDSPIHHPSIHDRLLFYFRINKREKCCLAYQSRFDRARCQTSKHGDQRSELTDHAWSARSLKNFWTFVSNEATPFQLSPLSCSVFICSFPGAQFKCHGRDCKMRSLLGSLLLPKENAAITPARRKKEKKTQPVVSIWEIQGCKKCISAAKIRSKNEVRVYCFHMVSYNMVQLILVLLKWHL